MKRLSIIIIFPLAFLFNSYAQEIDSEKMMLYESNKKNPTSAALLSLLVTSTGHAYAGNWGRGLGFAAGKVGCVVLAYTVGIKETTEIDMSGYYSISVSFKEEKTMFYFIGIVGAIGLTIWEMVDASNEVKKYNKKTYDRIFSTNSKIKLDFSPKKNGATINLSYNF